MKNAEAFTFLMKWKDSVLLEKLSGDAGSAFAPQTMQTVRNACAVLAEGEIYPFDLSVTDREIYRQVCDCFAEMLRTS